MKTKRILAILLAVVMVLAMAAPALADDVDDGSITVTNATAGQTYTLYKLFDLTYTDLDDGSKAVSYTVSADVKEAIEDNAAYLAKTYGTDPDLKYMFTFSPTSDEDVFTVTKTTAAADKDIIEWLNGLAEVDSTSDKIIGENEGILTKVPGTTASPNPATADSAQEVKFTGLSYGYYYVTSSLGTVVTVDSTLKNVSVVDKNQQEEFDKDIVIENPNYDEDYAEAYEADPSNTPYDPDKCEPTIKVKANSASIGDTVTYSITLDGTNYGYDESDPPEYKYVANYYIYDTIAEGLTIDPDSIKVTVTLEDGTQKVLTKGYLDTSVTPNVYKGDYNLQVKTATTTPVDEDDNEYDFIIEIPWVKEYVLTEDDCEDCPENVGETILIPLYNSAVTPIEVTYNALVNEKIDTANANTNNATYLNDLQDIPSIPDNPPPPPPPPTPYEGEPVDVVPAPTEPEVTTYTFDKKLVINKIDGSDSTKKLSGAKFQIEGESANVVLVDSKDFVLETTTNYFTSKVAASAKEAGVEYVQPDTSKDEWLPVQYWRLKSGDDDTGTCYTADAPILTDNYNTAWVTGSTADAFISEDGGTTYRPATDAEKLDGNLDLRILTKANVELYDDVSKSYKQVMGVTEETKSTAKTDNTGYTDDSGLLSFTGLGAGEYTITELEAPNGYNMLSEPIYVKIILEGKDSSGNWTDDLSGVDDLTTVKLNAYYADSSFNILSSDTKVAWDKNTEEPAKKYMLLDSQTTGNTIDKNTDMNVPNNKGVELPSTGGIGTTIFITIGALVMVGAGVFFVTNQRMRKEGY